MSEQNHANKIEHKDYHAIDPNFGKPIDKVEPKFKVGVWVVWNDKYYKVNYNSCGYELIDQDGLHTSLEYGTVDENAHIFSITDAKDGDILVYDGEIFMIKSCVLWNKIVYHCCYDGEILHRHSIYDSLEREDFDKVHPATKSQRDALMKAMADAGWEFDFEKKELKKIDTYCKENCKGFQETGRCFCDGECKAKKEHIKQNLQDNNFRRIEQKPAAWSEEDERMYAAIIFALAGFMGNEDKFDWFKSLKDRVQTQPKQEWNEEDETRLINVIIMLKEGASHHFIKDDITKAINWLKSFKKRIVWKPNEEQMRYLLKYAEQNNYDGTILTSLYNDLKRLCI